MEAAGDEHDGLSVHSAGRTPPSYVSSLAKEQSQVELEIRVLEALERYPPSKLQGFDRHFVIYGMMEYLLKSSSKNFSSEQVLQLLDSFFNLEMLKPEDEEVETFAEDDDFSLPRSFLIKNE